MTSPVFDLTTLPADAVLRSVTAVPSFTAGRSALKVQLTDAVALQGLPGVDYVDMPTFAILPANFRNGSISVDILARLTPQAPDYARGFAGLAYRIVGDGQQFESVYLRPLNGLKAAPPSPREKRAVQYFAFPDWQFERLRQNFPDGRFEAAADIGPNEWTNLTLHVHGQLLRVLVNGIAVLECQQTLVSPVDGAIGLFVDIGTEAFFSNLQITPTDLKTVCYE